MTTSTSRREHAISAALLYGGGIRGHRKSCVCRRCTGVPELPIVRTRETDALLAEMHAGKHAALEDLLRSVPLVVAGGRAVERSKERMIAAIDSGGRVVTRERALLLAAKLARRGFVLSARKVVSDHVSPGAPVVIEVNHTTGAIR